MFTLLPNIKIGHPINGEKWVGIINIYNWYKLTKKEAVLLKVEGYNIDVKDLPFNDIKNKRFGPWMTPEGIVGVKTKGGLHILRVKRRPVLNNERIVLAKVKGVELGIIFELGG